MLHIVRPVLYGGYQILVQKVFEGDLSCDWHIQETQSTFSKWLKFQFRRTIMSVWHVIINQSIYCRSKLVYIDWNWNFSAFWRHWQVLIRNNSSIANALKLTFHAYAFTWQILLRILFALKFNTPRMCHSVCRWKIQQN